MTLQGKKWISISTGNETKSRQHSNFILTRRLIYFQIGALHCVVCTDQGEVFFFLVLQRRYQN
jgi:hypothetical protein